MPLYRFLSYTVISIGSDEHPSLAKPSQGGEKRTAGWASHHEELCSDWVVSPHMCDHRVVPALGVVLDRCNPSGSAVDAGRDAAARARRAARAADGGGVDVPHTPMCRQVHRQCVRNEWPNLTTIVPVTAYHQRSYVETYSRSTETDI